MKKGESTLLSEFYELEVEQLVDKKIWDLPLIGRKEPISHVLSILDGKSHVWVVNNLEGKELVGVITRHDVLRILAPPKEYHMVFSVPQSYHHGTVGQAEDIMSKGPVTCRLDEKIVDVLTKMIRHRVRRLAVLKDNKIEGEITLRHLIHKYYRASQYYPITDEEKKE